MGPRSDVRGQRDARSPSVHTPLALLHVGGGVTTILDIGRFSVERENTRRNGGGIRLNVAEFAKKGFYAHRHYSVLLPTSGVYGDIRCVRALRISDHY